jgi:hypothetical protein
MLGSRDLIFSSKVFSKSQLKQAFFVFVLAAALPLVGKSQATDFGSVNVCAAGQTAPAPCTKTQTYLMTAPVTGILGTPRVVTDGVPNLDFKLLSTTCIGYMVVGSSCSVSVTFTPRFAGLRRGAIQLVNGSGGILSTTFLRGLGIGPQVAFSPSPPVAVPTGIDATAAFALDGADNLFVADAYQVKQSVLKIPADGSAITTIVNGLGAIRAIAVDGAGDVYVADFTNSQVLEILPDGSQTTVGVGLTYPTAIAVDGVGDLFICDEGHRVVEVSAAGVQSTIATGLNGLVGIAVDAAGNVLVIDREVNAPTSLVKLSALGGRTTVYTGPLMGGISLDAADDIFVTLDYAYSAVYLGGLVMIPADGSAPTTLLVGDTYTNPGSVAIDSAGNIFVTNLASQAIWEMRRSLPPALTFGTTEFSNTNNQTPQSVTVQNAGNAPLIESSLSVGSGFTQIPGSGTPADCSANITLAPGASCNLSISFNPAAAPVQSLAVLTNNSLNGNPAVKELTLVGAAQTTPASTSPAPLVAYVGYWGVNSSSATISWSTDIPANTVLAYGTTPALFQMTPVQTALANSHGVTLSGLNSGTTYYFVAESTSASGVTGYSGTYSFTTSGSPSVPAPVISNVAAISASATSAVITWITDQPSTSLVNYGPITPYAFVSPISSGLVTTHSVTLTGLTPGVAYNYDVYSQNSAGTPATSANYTFTVTAVPGTPVITAVSASAITSTSATINWTTDQATTSLVNYGASTAYGSSSVLNPSYVTSHSVTLTGLTPGFTYNYEVVSVDSAGVSVSSTNYTFATTSASKGTPPYVGYLAYWGINSSGVTISWSTDVLANTVLAYGTSSALGQLTPVQPALTASHGVVLTGLNSGTTYYFMAQSTGANGATGYSTTYSFTTTGAPSAPPSEPTPPPSAPAPYVGYVAFWGITSSGVTISWSTDLPANTVLAYGTTTALGQLTPVRTELTASHGVVLTGLNSGTTYYFVAESTAANGETGYSATYTFTTAAQ